ncbi:TetR/AcrR family transcriptional regulator [Nocardia colli]|uniref:TetR/AcrR family transcriptional regulator n=1 Tax=Nocardia colli TaxID=2545717 RepID=A0A5N0E3E4_9NOCA|nr:TetR/AcrR family transcriptional regulator [Nocardia colli]KAA8883938.1 TetR/AcrR family transcriptional regulator [Nocardia colli]
MPETTRRRTAPTKGDQREQAILDAAEEQLHTIGFDRMTIETITKAVGITRGAFYFYFASKNAVLAALVERTVTTLRAEVDAADSSGEPAVALRRSIDQTRDMWRDHGDVMRAAVELAPTVEPIGESWHSAVAAIRDTTRAIAERAGLSDNDSPTGAHAVTTALVWMTERAFYQASKTGNSLDDTAATLTHLWLHALGLRAQ